MELIKLYGLPHPVYRMCANTFFIFSYAGVNKNFQMMCIHDKLQQSMGRKISSQQIWEHLSTMYDMQALVRTYKLTVATNILVLHVLCALWERYNK